ncbi:hypothetical protein ARMGADRAFT_595402 [Armillaria gallica]|uniref:Uncharacterized protein n=1 Tax=Armillaria gallica TaxID=47427 RepID=A0A2H3D2M4_ARMGA|nr:hypothetical protein ARMGADRAFT_595402 [Armillaria gallica]
MRRRLFLSRGFRNDSVVLGPCSRSPARSSLSRIPRHRTCVCRVIVSSISHFWGPADCHDATWARLLYFWTPVPVRSFSCRHGNAKPRILRCLFGCRRMIEVPGVPMVMVVILLHFPTPRHRRVKISRSCDDMDCGNDNRLFHGRMNVLCHFRIRGPG